MKSKRNALRFRSNHQKVHYKTAYDAGEALLDNISAAGCGFKQPSLPLVIGEKILISIPLIDAGLVFQAQGVVVRIEKDGFTGINFTLVEPEDQAQMRNYFSNLMRKK